MPRALEAWRAGRPEPGGRPLPAPLTPSLTANLADAQWPPLFLMGLRAPGAKARRRELAEAARAALKRLPVKVDNLPRPSIDIQARGRRRRPQFLSIAPPPPPLILANGMGH